MAASPTMSASSSTGSIPRSLRPRARRCSNSKACTRSSSRVASASAAPRVRSRRRVSRASATSRISASVSGCRWRSSRRRGIWRGCPAPARPSSAPCEHPVIGLMTEWMRGNELEQREANGDLGGTMRLGAYDAVLDPESRVAAIYGADRISERHRHRYEVNIAYRDSLEAAGLRFSGMSPDGLLPEIVEILDHPWFVGVQFHPELKSKPFDPHPLFTSFVKAAVDQSRLV